LGGTKPYEVDVKGLPEGFTWESENNEIRIQGCVPHSDVDEFTASVSDKRGCQDADQLYRFIIESNPDCKLSELRQVPIKQRGDPTPDPAQLPDESVQKMVVDRKQNRYLVGFIYSDHNYTTDPNGPFAQHDGNYDIRITKYSDSGRLLWDKSYDTGNDDYGYAITLSAEPDQQRIYVGGGSEVESGPNAWLDAVLLEIDAESGCPVGEHFQSSGEGTTSVFYDIASDDNYVYSVGERQVNPAKPGGQIQEGGLVSVFSRNFEATKQQDCADHIIISDSDNDELMWEWNVVRQGAAPAVAYSVKLPGPDCPGCRILIGGAAGASGWLDTLNTSDQTLEALISLDNLSVQDIAVPEDRIIVAGSSSGNDMQVLAYDRNGEAIWTPKVLGNGRLRALAADPDGTLYAVGTTVGSETAGVIFKIDASGNDVDDDRLSDGSGVSFHDIAVFETGTGAIAGQIEKPTNDFGWLQVEFGCDSSFECK
jgi:hypothetical protein